MDTSTDVQDLFEEAGRTAAQAVTLWMETNEKLFRDLTSASAAAAVDSIRLYAGLVERSASAVSRSAERAQAIVEQAGQELQDRAAAAFSRAKSLYAPAE